MRYEYKVLSRVLIQDLEEEVSRYLGQGWKLAGGLVVDGQTYKQAVYTEIYSR